MELTLPLELEAKLSRLATDRGRDAQSIAQEAIERFIDHDEWLLQQFGWVWPRPIAATC